MEVKYGVYKVVGSKSELVIAYGEPHVPMRTRRKYAGKKAKIKAIEQLTGNVLDAHLSTSEINAYIGQYIFGTSQWAEYHRLFEYFASFIAYSLSANLTPFERILIAVLGSSFLI